MTKNDDALRLFVGVRPSLRTVADLSATVDSMQPVARAEKLAVRWLAPATYHVTLKFIGWARREVESRLCEVVGEAVAGMRRFDITFKGVGAFPSVKKAKVLWAGIGHGKDELGELAARIDRATAELGFPAETREFHPHVTIARMSKAADASALLLPFSEDTFRKSRVDSVQLYESVTTRKGAEYHVRAEWPLVVD